MQCIKNARIKNTDFFVSRLIPGINVVISVYICRNLTLIHVTKVPHIIAPIGRMKKSINQRDPKKSINTKT